MRFQTDQSNQKEWIGTNGNERSIFAICLVVDILFGLFCCLLWFQYTMHNPKAMLSLSFKLWGILYFVSAVVFLLVGNPALSLISMFGLLATWCLWCISR